jgi:hypothetical protein
MAIKISTIEPDKLYSDSDLDDMGFPSRAQRDRLKKKTPPQFPHAAKVTPGRNSYLGAHLLEHLHLRIAEARAKNGASQ